MTGGWQRCLDVPTAKFLKVNPNTLNNVFWCFFAVQLVSNVVVTLSYSAATGDAY